jgi:hypothetical protein
MIISDLPDQGHPTGTSCGIDIETSMSVPELVLAA